MHRKNWTKRTLKNVAILLLCIFVAVSSARSQVDYLGLKAGPEFINAFEASYLIPNSKKFNLEGGITGNFGIEKHWRFQSEILLETKGVHYADGTFGGARRHTLQFNELMQYKIPFHYKKSHTFYVQAGPYFAYRLFATSSNFNLTGEQVLLRFMWGADGGLLYEKQLKSGFLNVGLDYDFNIISISTKKFREPYNQSIFYPQIYVWSLTIGYQIPVKLKL